jgi:hypothetical protein
MKHFRFNALPLKEMYTDKMMKFFYNKNHKTLLKLSDRRVDDIIRKYISQCSSCSYTGRNIIKDAMLSCFGHFGDCCPFLLLLQTTL